MTAWFDDISIVNDDNDDNDAEAVAADFNRIWIVDLHSQSDDVDNDDDDDNVDDDDDVDDDDESADYNRIWIVDDQHICILISGERS